MKGKAFHILFLLAIVIAAPVVDATVCEDCKDILPLRGMLERTVMPAGQGAAQIIPGACDARSPETDPVQDLCPFCSHSVAAMSSLACDAPPTIGHTYLLPKLLSLSDPAHSITKPPQN